MKKLTDSLLALSVTGVGIPKETQKAHEFVWLVWGCDHLIIWPMLPFIIYNLVDLNSPPALVTLEWNIPASSGHLHGVCHKAITLICRMIGNRLKEILRDCPMLIFFFAAAQLDTDY